MKAFAILFAVFTFFACQSAYAEEDECIKLLAEAITNDVFDNLDAGKEVDIKTEDFIDFFVGNIDICKDFLIRKQGLLNVDNAKLGQIRLNWSVLRDSVAGILADANDSRVLFVCENHRALQVGIDVGLWVGTAVATFFTAGAGGPALAAGKTAFQAGLKTGVKAAIKQSITAGARAYASRGLAHGLSQGAIRTAAAGQVGGKIGLKTFLWTGAEALKHIPAGQVANLGMISVAKSWLWAGGKAATPYLTKRFLTEKISSNARPSNKGGAASFVYSLVDSKFSADVMNCQDTDKLLNGCYSTCDRNDLGAPKDSLNNLVIRPMYDVSVCVDRDTFVLHEIENGQKGPAFLRVIDGEWPALQNKIKANIQDKNGCNWNEDDIDLYIGKPIVNADTLTIEPAAAVIDAGIRLDE
jgi:hypothetical protein